MKKIVILAALTLSGCATPAVNCDTAEKVRTAAILTLKTLDRFCPAPALRVLPQE